MVVRRALNVGVAAGIGVCELRPKTVLSVLRQKIRGTVGPRRGSAGAGQAGLVGVDDELGPVPGPQLGHRPGGVGLHR